jgi:hypothetical protein
MALFFSAFHHQGDNEYQTCDQKDDTADQAERIAVYYTGHNKEKGAYDEKNPAPEFELQVVLVTII